ncbi:MAG: hypothetical protein LBG99_05740 [Propionibacteriaceae bacterium]|jgi:hypothetical protein|nr:hypothetical protein [Propionibacteriaceae bacterium]
MKKRAAVLMGCVISTLVIAGVYFVAIHGESPKEILSSEMEVDVSTLPIDRIRASYVIDVGNKNEVAGLADYVFAGRVISNNKTIYEDVIEMETEEGGTRLVGSPYTEYTIEVVDNIKGKLKKNKPITMLKDGGVSMDLDAVFLYEADELPEPGRYYIFIGFAQSDGALLISGPGSNLLLTAKNKQEIVSSDEYKAYKKAVQNEVKFDRERYKATEQE